MGLRNIPPITSTGRNGIMSKRNRQTSKKATFHISYENGGQLKQIVVKGKVTLKKELNQLLKNPKTTRIYIRIYKNEQ